MENLIIDGMQKEGKKIKYLVILGYGLTILSFVYAYVNNKSILDDDVFMMLIVYFCFGTFGLYMWLYSIKYKLTISNDKINLKTLFSKIEINIDDINKYTCNRYNKSEFYQFNLYLKDKKILINTRYKEELIELLKDRGIEQL
jgi:hypothetical protein